MPVPHRTDRLHLLDVTVSMRVMSAGDGYKYLLRTVAAGDGDRSLSTPLTRYYAEEGSPPGRWLGAGVAALGGLIVEGDQVSESQLQLLVGMGRNPVTGEPLGLAYPAYKTVAERVEESAERGGSDALLSAPLTVGSESDEAREVVLELRDEVRAVSPEALVGGATATSVDTDAASQRDYVVVIPAILLVVTLILVATVLLGFGYERADFLIRHLCLS